MLAAKDVSVNDLMFPVLSSPKIDGIRAMVLQGELVSRKLKLIPNLHIRSTMDNEVFNNLDGELVTLTDGKLDDFNVVQSKVMSEGGTPDWMLLVFDDFTDPSMHFRNRITSAFNRIRAIDNSNVKPLLHTHHHSPESLIKTIAEDVEKGYEGTMVRSPLGVYKFGRSTARERGLIKFKPLDDSEGVIVDVIELERNLNPQKLNELGFNKRSSHKDGKVPGGTMGALSIRWGDVVFELGVGFNNTTRDTFWRDKEALIGQIVSFTYQGVGPNLKPRFPRYKGIRHD